MSLAVAVLAPPENGSRVSLDAVLFVGDVIVTAGATWSTLNVTAELVPVFPAASDWLACAV